MSHQYSTEARTTAYGLIFRHVNGIVFIFMKDDLSISLPIAEKLVEDVRALDNSGQARLLIVQGQNNDLPFETQRYLGSVKGVIHLALVVHTRLQAEVAQFFIKLLYLLRSPYEMRVFNELDVAEAWLLGE